MLDAYAAHYAKLRADNQTIFETDEFDVDEVVEYAAQLAEDVPDDWEEVESWTAE